MTNFNLKPTQHMQTAWQHPWYEALGKLESTTTSAVPSTQKPNKDTTGQKSTKECQFCKEELPLDEFHKDKNRKDGRAFICKPCTRAHTKLVRELKKVSPPMPTHCDCCGKETESKKMRFDHDHETGLFRGWICQNCNLGIGQLGDNLDGVMNAVQYLNETTNRC